jgi:Domain of unknown function (DUF4160)
MIFPKDHPPAHVHVYREGALVVYDLATFRLVKKIGNMSKADVRKAYHLTRHYSETLKNEWRRIHGDL